MSMFVSEMLSSGEGVLTDGPHDDPGSTHTPPAPRPEGLQLPLHLLAFLATKESCHQHGGARPAGPGELGMTTPGVVETRI